MATILKILKIELFIITNQSKEIFMILQLKNIIFSFNHKQVLLDNINLTLTPNKIYALIGGNGSGKTTLFNLINGFHRPKSGKIFYKTTDITNSLTYKINRIGIGRTFQDLRLIPELTVKENVILAMKHNSTDIWSNSLIPGRFYKKEIKELDDKAHSIISRYYLKDTEDQLASEISFGQQKLLNLSCCVANDSDLLLLDEPIAGISPDYKIHIAILLKKLKEQGKTILMIEHDIDFISEIADTFLFLRNGAITQFEDFNELRTNKEAIDVYL